MRWGLVGASGNMGVELQKLLGGPHLACDERGCQGEGPLDVIFDFSSPSATHQVCRLVREHRCALVSGTTGLTEEQEKEIIALSQEVAVVRASNFSLGVAVMTKMASLLDEALSSWDCEVLETHHSAKKDAPSGTAKTLATALHRPVMPKSLRLGGVPGDHVLLWASADEMICLSHRAINRSLFARGALLAAQKLLEKPAGLYPFHQLIGV